MYKIHTRDFHQQNPSTLSYIECRCLKSIGVWAGGHGGGHVPPPNFYGRAKINAKFGQNILKVSEKF
jgi:hypothetical protein